MADSNTCKPFHHEHPPSGFAHKDCTLQTIFCVTNVMQIIERHISFEDLDQTELDGLATIYKECRRALSFEAIRMDEETPS